MSSPCVCVGLQRIAVQLVDDSGEGQAMALDAHPATLPAASVALACSHRLGKGHQRLLEARQRRLDDAGSHLADARQAVRDAGEKAGQQS